MDAPRGHKQFVLLMKNLNDIGSTTNSISVYGDDLRNHFFMTEIEEFSKRFEAVYVFLRYEIGEFKHLEEIKRLSNVTVIDMKGEGLSARVYKPIAFLFYVFDLLPWRRVFDIKCMKAAILNALVGWKTAGVVQQSGLVSKFHVSFWGRSPEFLVALKRMNPEYVVGTRLHSFDLYFSFAKEWQLSTRLKALNSLDFVAPISEHGAMHLKDEGVEVRCRTSYLGCRDNEFLFRSNGQRGATKSSEVLKIATIAKVVPVKRLDYTIDVLNQLESGVVWHQYGRLSINEKDTDHINLVRNKVRESNSKRHHLAMKGELSNVDLRQALAEEHYDFVLLLSESEGVPVSLMEALASDTRIVVTDTNGCPELVQKDTGCLIPVDATAEECAQRIEKWWNGLSGVPGDGKARKLWKGKFDAAVLYDGFVEFLHSFLEQ